MLEVVTLMMPIFLMIGIGALFVRVGWFPASGLPILNRFVMNACIPVLLFSAVANGGGLNMLAFSNAALFAAASLCSAFILLAYLRLVLHEPMPQASILAMAGGSANTVFLGFPIALAVIPDRAEFAFSWVVLGEVLFIIPVMITIAEFSQGSSGGGVMKRIARSLLMSPVTIGLAAGIAFVATGLVLPGPIDRVVRSITQAAPFIALFLIGGLLLEVRLTHAGPRVIAISISKLFVHPAMVTLAFVLVFGWHSQITRDALFFASIPVFASYVVFCSKFGVGEVGASAIFVTTLAGAVTVTAVLTFLLAV